jgi:hypothetical protein
MIKKRPIYPQRLRRVPSQFSWVDHRLVRDRHIESCSHSALALYSRSKSFHLTRAHLLPKLRCHFAEFLNQSSLTRLRILSSPTCVGLRYGHLENSLRGFSWQRGINQFVVIAITDLPG